MQRISIFKKIGIGIGIGFSVLGSASDRIGFEKSSSAYGSPIIPIMKKHGEVRIAIDYRRLNKKTIPRRFPIPHPQDLIENVRGASVFSVVDLKQAYFHVAVKPSDRPKTAFLVPWGKYQWKRLPLGLLGAPFTFGEAMAYLFRDLEFVVCYFDDILIFSKNITDHLKHLKMTLDRLAEYGFIINDDKWQLFQEEVLFLGYRVSGKGMCLRVWPSKPLDLISIDFLVDLPKTARGNVHILVINDHFYDMKNMFSI